jgi:hypothetical protein
MVISDLVKEKIFTKLAKLDVTSNKFTLSVKGFGVESYFNVSRYNTQIGFTSLLNNGKHLPMLDADNLNDVRYIELRNILKEKQKEHDLSNIYVFSDLENSYRFLCFSEVSFKVFLFDIIGDCSDYDLLYVFPQSRECHFREFWLHHR